MLCKCKWRATFLELGISKICQSYDGKGRGFCMFLTEACFAVYCIWNREEFNTASLLSFYILSTRSGDISCHQDQA